MQAPMRIIANPDVQRIVVLFEHLTMQLIRGGSHLQLSANGRIALHRDYWDAAEELYEKLPVLGVLMRWLKRRAKC